MNVHFMLRQNLILRIFQKMDKDYAETWRATTKEVISKERS